MSSNEGNFIKDFMAVVDLFAKAYVDQQRKQEVDKVKDAALDPLKVQEIVPLINQLAKTPAWVTVKDMIQDIVVQKLEDESFSPCDAAKPAHQLLQALETIRSGGVELQRWANDNRFKLPKANKVTAPPRFNLFCWTPPPQRVNVPVAEIIEQLQYLMRLLSVAEKEAQRALETMAHVRDPRLRIAPEHLWPQPDDIEAFEYFIPLPTSWYKSQGDKGRDLLTCLEEFGKYLQLIAERGMKRIRDASVDDMAFSPAVVGAQAVTISNTVKNALSTCTALEIVSMQYIGEAVILE